jgi:hypothetical protein
MPFFGATQRGVEYMNEYIFKHFAIQCYFRNCQLYQLKDL